MKLCDNCKLLKEYTDFYTHLKYKDGYRPLCKSCHKSKVKTYDKTYKPEYLKQYRKDNYEKLAQARKQRYKNRVKKNIIINKSQYKPVHDEQYYKDKSEKKKQYNKQYRKDNYERITQREKQYYHQNRKERIDQAAHYARKRTKIDNIYKFTRGIRSLINGAFKRVKTKNFKKQTKTYILLGCTIVELRVHLEKQFQPGMTFENYGLNGWHIDHIIPLASANTQKEIESLCHYTNLQPLWAKDNIKKGSRY
jgi:hypothetical protein